MEPNFDDKVDTNSYYQTHVIKDEIQEMRGSYPNSSGRLSSRGIRGPLDRFIPSKDSEHGNGKLPLKDAKEASKLVTLDLGVADRIGDNKKIVEDVKKTWKATGMTIMSYSWAGIRGRILLSFLVNNPKGTLFLKSIDVSNVVKDNELIFKLLYRVTEEVGDDIVVQVVTDNVLTYKGAEEEKEEISKNLKGDSGAYKEIWDIIDKRWEFQMLRHLRATSGLFQVKDKLIVNHEEMELANVQLDVFVDKRGVFEYLMAQSTINKRYLADWRNIFGYETPDLKKFEVKVLSLTCTTLGLSVIRAHLIKRLNDRHLRRQRLKENEDPLIIDHVPSDNE
ncbi:hypothetical protein Ddye_022700 [Dipteronia dyeriana]|uniref:DUF659 domain-containing protein n=1 Tax=Dipteronia dyeriana TaxID=168575 RepID=A0AAD9WSM1_9ROSI|nr:hypothetical protein Ddye_022700 [Dipteronia dyeriana]